jgi:hypothetical protein
MNVSRMEHSHGYYLLALLLDYLVVLLLDLTCTTEWNMVTRKQ